VAYYAGKLSDKLSVGLVDKLAQATINPRWAAMQQSADWVKQLGISEYTERFAENGIDISVPRADLKDRRFAPPSPIMLNPRYRDTAF
jgi:hypothetical protein